MPLTTDPEIARKSPIGPDGQQETYVVLPAEERAKAHVRPVRMSYRHVGARPKYPLRDLTPEEHERYDQFGYVAYEAFPPGSSVLGRFWTAKQLKPGCGAITSMSQAIAETYASDPKFYGGTYCSGCRTHLALGSPDNPEFVWTQDGEPVGSTAEEAAAYLAEKRRAVAELNPGAGI